MSEDEKVDFEALFLDTRAHLLGYLTRRVLAQDAVDLLGEVYLIAWCKRAALPPGEERRLWLFGVARRLVAEHHRTAPGRAITADPPTIDREEDQEHGGDRRGAAVRTALASLNDVDRELLTLTTWERLSTADAARILGITAGTARVRLHRARARLARDPGLRSTLGDSGTGVPEEAPATPAGAGCPAGAGRLSGPPALPERTVSALVPPPEQVPAPQSAVRHGHLSEMSSGRDGACSDEHGVLQHRATCGVAVEGTAAGADDTNPVVSANRFG